MSGDPRGPVALVVDDEAMVRNLCAEILRQDGFTVLPMANGEDALRVLEETEVSVAVIDIYMPIMDGFQLLQRIRESHPHLPVVVMTARATIDAAVKALQLGADEFLEKPFSSQDLLITTVRKSMKDSRMRRENAQLRERVRTIEESVRLIGASPAMLQVKRLIERVAPLDVNVLILGETGTGKEVVARSIHAASPRGNRPFVALNCSATPETLINDRLFGHERGAFTGADRAKKGVIEMAHQSTLFLDEIGDISKETQVSLLRVLQERTIMRLGSTKEIPVDFRLIAATNRDLAAEVREGRFRQDLYYRLNVMTIKLPPLRDRSEDVPLLAKAFLRKHAARLNKEISRITPEALSLLQRYPWPGNVRELDHAIERAVILCENDVLKPEDFDLEGHHLLPEEAARTHHLGLDVTLPFAEAKKSFERLYFQELLRRHRGNVTQAARAAKFPRQNVHKKLVKLGIDARAYRN